ncbi:MAG: energy-coupling factor transporter ATPase [Bacillota bacterium]|nr:energy-coupling factor transporter ATPase [Bacillota bacterium]
MAIITEKLTHIYQQGTPFEAKAVDEVSMHIRQGEFCGIIGHTGSGKTTLVQHFNGLLKPTSGTLSVLGIDLNQKYDRKALRMSVGLVFQYPEYQLFEETVEKDVGFGPRNLGLSEDEVKDRVREALEHVELEYSDVADKSPFELSGGQKRRAAIAGVIAMRPKVLILDEPTAGLDPTGRKNILGMIVSLKKKTGCTIVMVSHNMDELSKLADTIYVMNEGSVIASGAPKDVFANENELTRIGLDVPQLARLGSALRRRGFFVPEGVFTAEEMAKHIAGKLKGDR